MVKEVNINEVKLNPNNPRFINEKDFNKLVKSVKEFPEMLEKRPIVVDENYNVLGGNMRLNACKKAGLNNIWISIAEGWTDEKKKEFIVKDNSSFGEWDWEILANDWTADELKDWGVDLPFDFAEQPLDNELSEDFENKKNKITITFDTAEDLQSAETDIQKLLDEKYPNAYFSVNSGII